MTARTPTQPLEAKVNPRKWTTKVNIAMVIAVLVIFLIGAGYVIHAVLNHRERDVYDGVNLHDGANTGCGKVTRERIKPLTNVVSLVHDTRAQSAMPRVI